MMRSWKKRKISLSGREGGKTAPRMKRS